LTHPTRTKHAATIENYKLLDIWIPYSDESWKLKRGGKAAGWLLRAGTGAPAIILSHSYGQNMADLLSLGVSLQRAGYNVLLYDLRGHSENKEPISTLGVYEADDLLSTIEYLKSVKDQDGNLLIDQDRIGLYGVSVGGYASLVAASKDSAIKAVAVDGVYPDIARYVQVRVNEQLGAKNPLNSLLYFCANLGMRVYFRGSYSEGSALNAVRSYSNVQQLYIMGKDAGELLATTGDVYNQAIPPKETVEVPHSRISILYKSDQDVYDPVVVDFFRRADVLPPLSAEKEKSNLGVAPTVETKKLAAK
jgi:fermentation-respiration switch protein FrsA (DUF1100 family)